MASQAVCATRNSPEWEWCRENPVARVSMEQERNRRDRWLSTGEEERLLQAPGHDPVRIEYRHANGRDSSVDVGGGVDLFRKAVTVFRSKNGERRTIPINMRNVLSCAFHRVHVIRPTPV